MQIDPETWAKIRVAVQFDDTETFHQLVQSFADRVVHHEAARRKATDRARTTETPCLDSSLREINFPILGFALITTGVPVIKEFFGKSLDIA